MRRELKTFISSRSVALNPLLAAGTQGNETDFVLSLKLGTSTQEMEVLVLPPSGLGSTVSLLQEFSSQCPAALGCFLLDFAQTVTYSQSQEAKDLLPFSSVVKAQEQETHGPTWTTLLMVPLSSSPCAHATIWCSSQMNQNPWEALQPSALSPAQGSA